VIDKVIDRELNGDVHIVNSVEQLEAFRHYYYDPNVKPEKYHCTVGERNFGVGRHGGTHFCPITGELGNMLKKHHKTFGFHLKPKKQELRFQNARKIVIF